VASDREREELFADWADEVERAAREERKAEDRRRRAALAAALQEAPWAAAPEATWRRAQEKLAGVEAFEALDKGARLEVWEAHVAGRERAEAAAREAAREEARRQERRNRDALRALLARHREEGLLHAKSRWRVRILCSYLTVKGPT
jgi:hypothetical protein